MSVAIPFRMGVTSRDTAVFSAVINLFLSSVNETVFFARPCSVTINWYAVRGSAVTDVVTSTLAVETTLVVDASSSPAPGVDSRESSIDASTMSLVKGSA